MRRAVLALALAGCASPAASPADASVEDRADVAVVDATPDVDVVDASVAVDVAAPTVDAAVADVDPSAETPARPGESDPAGSATSRVFDVRAFDQPLTGLAGEARTAYFVGQAIFQIDWTTSATSDRAGLGPVYNSTSCQACHFGNGRGAPPGGSGRALISALLRVSVPGADAHGGPAPHPLYGDQIQPSAIGGVPAEGTVRVFFDEVVGACDDGERYTLLRPRAVFEPALVLQQHLT